MFLDLVRSEAAVLLDLALFFNDRRFIRFTAFIFSPFCETGLTVSELLAVFLTTVVLKIVVIFVLIWKEINQKQLSFLYGVIKNYSEHWQALDG